MIFLPHLILFSVCYGNYNYEQTSIHLILSCCFLNLFAQNKTVRGIILDNNRQPLALVTVKQVGGINVATTDATEAFTLQVPATSWALEISYVGFITQIISIPTGNYITVVLIPETGILEEVVITGISRQKNSEYSGAETKVSSKKIAFVPMGSFDQIFQGRSPGLLDTAS